MREVDRLHRLMVVIEGPRGVGKSTLAVALRASFDQQVWVVEGLAGRAYVNDDLVNRPLDQRRNYLAELGFLERGFDVRQVVLFAAPLVIAHRRLPTLGDQTDAITRVKEEQATYARWAGLSKRFVPTLEVWHNSDAGLTELVAHVANWLEQLKEDQRV